MELDEVIGQQARKLGFGGAKKGTVTEAVVSSNSFAVKVAGREMASLVPCAPGDLVVWLDGAEPIVLGKPWGASYQQNVGDLAIPHESFVPGVFDIAGGDPSLRSGGGDVAAILDGLQTAVRSSFPNGYTVRFGPGDYRWETQYTVDGPLRLQFDPGAIVTFGPDIPAAGAMINEFVAPFYNSWSGGSEGDIAVSGINAGEGDWVMLRSDDDMGHVSALAEYPQNLYRIDETGVLAMPMIYDYSTSPQWSAMRMQDRIIVEGMTYRCEGTRHRIFNLRQVDGLKLHGIRSLEGAAGPIQLFDCVNFEVDGYTIDGHADDSIAPWGYGLSVGPSSAFGSVRGINATGVRHAITTIGSSGSGIYYAGVRELTVSDSRVYGSRRAAFDTHQGSDSVHFVNCHANGSESIGFHLRGNRQTVKSSSAVECSGPAVWVEAGARDAVIDGLTADRCGHSPTSAEATVVQLDGIDGLVTGSAIRKGGSTYSVYGGGTGSALMGSRVLGYGSGLDGTGGTVATSGLITD